VLAARVRCTAQDGEANRALYALLAQRLGAPSSSACLVAGSTSRLKQVAVSGDPAALVAKLETLSANRE
jgi:uncharacterized protein